MVVCYLIGTSSGILLDDGHWWFREVYDSRYMELLLRNGDALEWQSSQGPQGGGNYGVSLGSTYYPEKWVENEAKLQQVGTELGMSPGD